MVSCMTDPLHETVRFLIADVVTGTEVAFYVGIIDKGVSVFGQEWDLTFPGKDSVHVISDCLCLNTIEDFRNNNIPVLHEMC